MWVPHSTIGATFGRRPSATSVEPRRRPRPAVTLHIYRSMHDTTLHSLPKGKMAIPTGEERQSSIHPPMHTFR